MSGQWTKDLQLCAVDADVDGVESVVLSTTEPLAIGRSSKGLRLPDPLVSIHHARIEFDEKRGYVVTDLDSATGTWVDEQCIQNDSRPIGLGTRLRFGDSHFEVRRVRRVPFWMVGVLAATLILCVGTVAGVYLARVPPLRPLLKWTEPVRQSATLSSELIDVPLEFTRMRGIDINDLRIRRVTDRDYNGLDEIWFRDGSQAEYLVTFAPDGSWVDLGTLPVDCHEQAPDVGAAADGFPVLDCAGVTYSLIGGRYRGTAHDGVVVWVNPPAPGATEPHEGEPDAVENPLPPSVTGDPRLPRPMRVVLRESSRLAGFLAERGITESIHYLICEEAFPGVKAQVLTSSGQLRPLSFGCVGSLFLSQSDVGRPVAAAFTAAGREALLDDVRIFYGGNADGLFLPEEMEARLEEATRSPGYQRGSIKLSSDATPVFVEPVAQERLLPGGRTLIPKDQRNPASAASTTATLVTEGTAELDPPGCAKLRTHTGPFRCEGLCTSGTVFLTVEEIGCSAEPKAILTVPYGGGTVDAEIDGLELRAMVESAHQEVLRARITWRAKVR